jgi:hypothetical protein
MVVRSHLLAFCGSFHIDFAVAMRELDEGGMLYGHPEKQEYPAGTIRA